MNGPRYRIGYGASAFDDLDRLPGRKPTQILRQVLLTGVFAAVNGIEARRRGGGQFRLGAMRSLC
jgi:hypothetical protein